MPTLKDDEIWISTSDAMIMLGCRSETTFWRYRRHPYYADLEFPTPIKIGREYRWRKSSILEVIARLEKATVVPAKLKVG
ncbi:MAG: hypothetical protein WDN46_24195 [Methylocella sp.]